MKEDDRKARRRAELVAAAVACGYGIAQAEEAIQALGDGVDASTLLSWLEDVYPPVVDVAHERPS